MFSGDPLLSLALVSVLPTSLGWREGDADSVRRLGVGDAELLRRRVAEDERLEMDGRRWETTASLQP